MQPQRSADKRPSYAAAVHSPLSVVCASASPQAESSRNADGDDHAPAAKSGSSLAGPAPTGRPAPQMTWPPRASDADSASDWSLEDGADADTVNFAGNGDSDAHSELLPTGECRQRPRNTPVKSGPSEWAQLLRTLFVVGLPMVARQLGALFSRQVLSRVFGRLRAP